MTKQTINVTLVLILLIVSTRLAYAHGGAHFAYLSQRPVGPYTLDIWGYSERPQAGKVFLEGSIIDPETGTPALRCDLFFQVTHLDDGTVFSPIKTQSPTVETGFRHLGTLDLTVPGTYHITAIVMDPDGQAGAVAFEMTVDEVSIWFKWIVISMLLFYSLVGLWLLKEGPRVWGIKLGQTEKFNRQCLIIL